MIARVLRAAGGTYRVRAGGREFDCSLRGRIKQEEGQVAVGDRVAIEELEDGSCRISEVLPRRNALARRAFARRKDRVMAANVDQVAAVVAAAQPDPDLFMLDRLLAVAEIEEIDGFVVLNKIDLAAQADAASDARRDTETDSRGGATSGRLTRDAPLPPDGTLPPELSPYAAMGYDVLGTSAVREAGIGVLRDRLAGRTTVLAGPSGVGKSSLLNALDPGLDLRVGDVGDRSGRGRHTTTRAKLIALDDETFIADTPGIQHFVPAAMESATLGHAFREFRPYLGACRFVDCRHREEPGCAVRDALEAREIARRRYDSYLALLETAEQAEEEAKTGGAADRG